MLSIKLNHVFVLIFIRFSSCERRIVDGQELASGKPCMVYITKAEESPVKYDTWLCGGVIINTWFILTSAACVEDVRYMYAIAGYKKYVQFNKLDADECTKLVKRKIVRTYVPEAYNLSYNKLEKWSAIDIAIVKVETPYVFNDKSHGKIIAEHCSYRPNKIAINFDLEYEEAGVDAIVLGWGHLKKWRQVDDKTDYNQNSLHYAPTKVFHKNDCKRYFTKPDLSALIHKYMICTFQRGAMNDRGEMNRRKYPAGPNSTAGSSTHVMSNTTQTNNFLNKETLLDSKQVSETRRQGICQNDHGGPLITWVEGRERVIGVASVFRVNKQSECVPPYLFTSTARNKLFIECVLNEDRKERRSALCDQPPKVMGFRILRRHISWEDRADM